MTVPPDAPTEQLPSTSPSRPRRQRWLWISLASIAVLLVIGSVLAVATSSPAPIREASLAAPAIAPTLAPPPAASPAAAEVTVPALVGLTGNAASDALTVAGVLDVRFAVNYAPMTNLVTSQSPMPGTKQRAGDPVFLTLQPPGAQPSTALAPAASAPADSAVARFDDGMYEVGTDIAAGRYKTTGEGSIGVCAWASYPDSSRNYTEVIDGATSTGQMYLTVKSGEFLEVAGGCTWTKQG